MVKTGATLQAGSITFSPTSQHLLYSVDSLTIGHRIGASGPYFNVAKVTAYGTNNIDLNAASGGPLTLSVGGVKQVSIASTGLTLAGGIPFTIGVLQSSSNSVVTTAGTGYVPGDIITVTGGTASRAARVAVVSTQAVSATVVNGGSGGTNGAVTVTGTTGTGTLFQFSGTISGGVLTGPLVLVSGGSYRVNPTNITAEPVTGGGLVGATVSVQFGVQKWRVADPGSYGIAATNPVAQGSTSGSGTGATFPFAWGPIAAAINYVNLEQSGTGNFTIGGTNDNNDASTVANLAGVNLAGVENTFVGVKAGGRATIGDGNTAIGHNAFGSGANVAVTGSWNTVVGMDAMRNVGSTASNNAAIGASALRNVSTGSNNIGIGTNALISLTTSSDSIAIGYIAGQNITNGQNVIIGSKAASAGTSSGGGINVIVGYSAGLNITNAANNVLIGPNTGGTLTTGSRNILIGNGIDVPSSSTSDYLNIGGLITADLSASVLTINGPIISNGVKVSTINWSVKTANYTAVAGDKLYCNTTSGVFSITLPATPSTGNAVAIKSGPSASTNTLTIARNGSTIMGLSEDMTITTNNAEVVFVYDGSTWRI
jgi:hypothetical protein